MGIKKEDALAFVQKLVTLYFSKRDMSAIPMYMEERTSWIGTGQGEISNNLEEAIAALSGDVSECSEGFTVTDISLEFTPLSETGGVVYGMLKAMPEDATLSEEDMRLSVILEQCGDDLKLVHMHFSHADLTQESGSYFVKQTVRADNESLRQELNIRERQLANLTKNIPGGTHQCANDPNLTLLSMSDGFLSMFGYTREEVETQFDGKFINMVYPGDRMRLLKTTYEQLQSGSDIELEYRVLCKQGQPVWVLDKGRLVDDGNGESCFYCLLIDIDQRKYQEEELRLTLERHQVIMDQAVDIIFEWDIRKDTLEFSANWNKKFGYNPIDSKISARIPLSENIHEQDIPAFVKIMKDTAAGVPYSEAEFRICDIHGKYSWCRIRATTQYNVDGVPIKAVGVIVDIDEEKKQKETLIAQAQQDTLTGIYNKAAINTLVEQKMESRFRSGKMSYQALLIIDVDYFKAVNDTYGHPCGDAVLSNVAAALRGSTRSDDLVGRIGGDEFLIYLPEVTDETAVRKKTQQLLEKVNSIRPQASAPPISCSIGVVVLPYGSVDYHTLYQYADKALYQRKSAGRDGVTFWKQEEQGAQE